MAAAAMFVVVMVLATAYPVTSRHVGYGGVEGYQTMGPLASRFGNHAFLRALDRMSESVYEMTDRQSSDDDSEDDDDTYTSGEIMEKVLGVVEDCSEQAERDGQPEVKHCIHDRALDFLEDTLSHHPSDYFTEAEKEAVGQGLGSIIGKCLNQYLEDDSNVSVRPAILDTVIRLACWQCGNCCNLYNFGFSRNDVWGCFYECLDRRSHTCRCV